MKDKNVFYCKVTYTSVGYGDITPVTWIGRSIAMFTAFMVTFRKPWSFEENNNFKFI